MIPWAMNRNVRFKTGIGPLLDPMESHPILEDDVLLDLSSKLQPVGKAISLTRAALPE